MYELQRDQATHFRCTSSCGIGNSFSSQAADTEKASPAPSRRLEILEFMKQRVKGGQALGHYDSCKAFDCHVYAHASTEP